MASQRSMICRGPRVGGPGLRLLLVGHGHHPQGQDLVDLGRVEQRPGALRGHLRVVVQDDRRDQDDVGGPGRAGQHRPAAVLPASRGRRLRRPRAGRAARRTRRPVASSSRWAPISEVRMRLVLVRGRARGSSSAPRPTAARSPAEPGSARTVAASGQRAGRPGRARSPASVTRLDVLPAGDRRPDGRRSGSSVDADRGRATSCSTASSQLTRGRRRRLAVSGATLAPLQLQEAQVDGDLGLRASPAGAGSRHWVAIRGVLAQPVRGRARRAEHAELPAHLVLGRGGPVG